ncbi:MAG: helix-turn-helix domain-containing protein [Candidatus Aminicenantales bacterium]
MASLGQFLQRERELRGITLKEIANSTKINLKFLQALEDDNLEILPGEFFIKAIIRSYARAIGLEEDYVLNKYYEDSLLKTQAELHEFEKEKEKKQRTFFPGRENVLNILFFVILAALIVASIYLISRPQRQASPTPIKEITPQASKEKVVELPAVESGIKEKEEEREEIVLGFTFTEDTWLQVYADGRLALEGIKKPGEEELIRASREIILHLGNAGGFSYSLNGKEGKSLGTSGAVVKNVRITLDNLGQFIEQEKQ